MAGDRDREFHFSDRDFTTITRLIGDQTGIVLTDAKRHMVYSRLARRLRALGLSDFKSYLNIVKQDDSEELVHFVNALTTNLTAFFREEHHFTYLAETVLPELMADKKHSKQIRIWSAGCSTGEEPYSIAMTLKEAIPKGQGWDVRILATDLDSNVVNTAQRGIYTEERVAGLTKSRLRRWFLKGRGANAGKVRVNPDLQEMIAFRQLNLMNPWPIKGMFDVIFCRNVIIYFNKETQKKLVTRYADHLIDEGRLFLGHSESLFKVTDLFKLVGNTIYQKC